MEWSVYQGIGVPSNPVFHNAPSRQERKKALCELNVPLIRWIEHWDHSKAFPFYGVIQDHYTDISDLKGQVRYEVKRAQKKYHFVELSLSDILNEGYSIYCSAFNTYKTFLKPLSYKDFAKSIRNDLYGEKNYSKYFGVREIYSKALVCYAYGVHYSEGNYFDLKVVKFDPKHKKYNISELLFHEISKYLLLKNKLNFIFDGFVSVAHQSKIQEYLMRKFNYRRAYCKLCIYYKFHIRLFIFTVFPFRRIIKIIGKYFTIFHKLSILLLQEELSRNCK